MFDRAFWFSPGEGRWTILVRLLLAGVFVPEGIQKLIFPEILGAGRFAKIGIPWPEFTGPLVGWFELGCGLLLLVGLFGRLASVPIIVIMIVAIVSTKIPILLGHDWLIFHVRSLDSYGFWSMAHETRTDWAMLLGAVFVLLSGSGRWSLDERLWGLRTEVGSPTS
ncbi:DoxX family protein [Sphingobium sp. GW456-12-10-14-TSB1]|uniref:DoxX family protein n=1 Tax=Sphingobium sp. GW456-12-10-14-TSB1 TaxID=1987165 RepID=UPI000A37D472|nr:DoxX family protein [Sphingobium sp. GW456-12-10-14-TSB1]